jgi:ketosteroid isomerase-like protein
MNTAVSEITHICEIYKKSVYEKDYMALSNIYHEGIKAFDLWGKGIYESKIDWSNNLKTWLTSLKNEKVKVSFESLKVEANEMVGFAHALVTYRAMDENNVEQRKMKNRLSWGLVKVENNWLIAHQHTSVPIEFETTKAIFFPQA